MTIETVEIRRAVPADAEALTRLSADLGYDVSLEAASRRLQRVTANTDHEVLVAEDASGTVVGWVHVFAAPRVESALFAELGGLVVAAGLRRHGIGTRLVEAAQAAARRFRAETLRIRSRIEREPAHRFFESLGFETAKNQLVYEKLFQEKDM